MFLLFNITNPFKQFVQIFWKHGWYWDKKLTTYKFFEIQTFIDAEHLFQFELDLRLSGRDHAGPSVEVVFLCLGLTLKIYDSRHWDYEENCWDYTAYKDNE
jgi:hypothetical protein